MSSAHLKNRTRKKNRKKGRCSFVDRNEDGLPWRKVVKISGMAKGAA